MVCSHGGGGSQADGVLCHLSVLMQGPRSNFEIGGGGGGGRGGGTLVTRYLGGGAQDTFSY